MRCFYLTIILFVQSLIGFSYTHSDFIKADFDSIKEKADAIVLNDNLSFTIFDEYSAELSVSRQILIKNKRADKYCEVVLIESEFVEYDDIKATIKDVNGNIIKELKSSNIQEAELSPGYVFYSGSRYKWFTVSHNIYPFIIEYSYTGSLQTLFLWPNWYPQKDIPTLVSEYKLKIPSDVKFKHTNLNINITPNEQNSGSDMILSWRLENIPPSIQEDYMPPENTVQMAVYFAADKFYINDYLGSNAEWNKFADWYRRLTDKRYELPPKAKDEIKNLISGINDPHKIISILFNYLQKKTRYVAIEMGLAGWQPQKAADVYVNNYGDCKDLTTFMIAILDVAGIQAYPALALMREDGYVDTTFIRNQFNHCIAFVPLEKDTVWLECTDSYCKAGEMHNNIEDIITLVVKPDNGELIRTPSKNFNQNYFGSKITGRFTEGNLNFKANIYTAGNHRDFIKTQFDKNSDKDDLIFLTDILSKQYSNLWINNFKTEDNNSFNIALDGTYSKFLTATGNRLFFCPSIFNKVTPDMIAREELGKRKFDVFLRFQYSLIDTVVVDIPERYEVEVLPSSKEFSVDFANYKSEYSVSGNQIIYIRTYRITDSRIPVNKYADYKKFMKDVADSDKAKIVFKKSSN